MSRSFEPGDFLIFQLEAGFSLLRLIDIDLDPTGNVYHVAGYREFFPDIETAERAIDSGSLAIEANHIALTERAFESTQVAKIANRPLETDLADALTDWRNATDKDVSDRSVRLMLGFK